MKKSIWAVAVVLLSALFMSSFQRADLSAQPDKKAKGGAAERPNAATIKSNTLRVISAYEERLADGKPQLSFWLEDGHVVTFTGDSAIIAGTYHLTDARNSSSNIVVMLHSYGYSPVEADYQLTRGKGDVLTVVMNGTTKTGVAVGFYYHGTPVNYNQNNGGGYFACGKQDSKLTAGYVEHHSGSFHYYLRDKNGSCPIRIVTPIPIAKKEFDFANDTTVSIEVFDPKNPNAFFRIRNGLLKIKRSGDSFTLAYTGQSPIGDIELSYKGTFFVHGPFSIEYGKSELYYTEPPYQKGKEIITPQYRVKAQ